MAKIGIHCTNREALRENMLVSHGLRLLNPIDAEALGYLASIAPEIVVPSIDDQFSLQPATDAELDAVIAGPDTDYVMQLCWLPMEIGKRLFELCTRAGMSDNSAKSQVTQLAPAIVGQPMANRMDAPDELSATVDPGTINSLTLRPAKIGDHIDGPPTENASLLIVNLGLGIHWHRITPAMNRESVGSPYPSDRASAISNYADPNSLTTYWFKLDPPRDNVVASLMNSPVGHMLHDGSTLGSNLSSTKIYCDIEPVRLGAYPSTLVS